MVPPRIRPFVLGLSLLLAFPATAAAGEVGDVEEFVVAYPGVVVPPVPGQGCPHPTGSTHEIHYDEARGGDLWITGQNYDTVVRVGLDGSMTYHPMPKGSGPHGIAFDAAGRLWVTLEFHGKIVRLDLDGKIVEEFDVSLPTPTAATEIPTHPHGLGIGADGKTVWFTGKATGTVGKIDPDTGKVSTFALKTVGSVPIYIAAGGDGNMWVTELLGNAIARVTPNGDVTEFAIPTCNSRPIAIVPEPGGKAMWFSEEAGNKVARIRPDGTITEFPVPKTQNNVILAGLAFDKDGDLWVQQYVDLANPNPSGPDHVIEIDRAILTAPPGDISKVRFTYYQVPTRQTVMHRIIHGPDGNMWFTELQANRVGRVTTAAGSR